MRSFLRSRTPVLGLGGLLLVIGLGIAATVLFAIAPVDQDSVRYSFRPAAVSGIAAGDSASAVASLALARSSPDSMRVTMPCEEAGSTFSSTPGGLWRAIPGAEHSPLLLAGLGPVLSLVIDESTANVYLDQTEILRGRIDIEPDCRVVLDYDIDEWGLTTGGETVGTTGSPFRFTEAAFSGPAATHVATSVEVSTRELGSSPSAVQLVLLAVAVGALLTAGREVVVRTAGGPIAREGRRARLVRIRQGVGLVDVAVVGVLVVWWILIPVGFDDGWVVERQRGYTGHGGFSQLFDLNAATLPFAYWLEWIQHFWHSLSSQPLVTRIPVLLIGVGMWAGLRSVGRSFGIERSGSAGLVMAAAYVVGFGAWGMTLRPEPVIAALVLASVAMAIRFDRGERGWVLAAWVAVIALSVTSHPAGVMAVAPALASWRSIWAWVRMNREALFVGVTLVGLLVGITLVLFFFDTNLSGKLESIDSVSIGGHDKSVTDEALRYELLDDPPYGTPLRRSAVALMVVGLGAFAVGSRAQRPRIENLPAWSLLIGIGLLAFTPSKWAWHFGGLLGLAALVVAIELRRVDRERIAFALLGIGMAVGWAWSVAQPWTALDLRTFRWWPGAVNLLPVDLSSWVVWTVAGFSIWAVLSLVKKRRERAWSAPESMFIVAWLAVVMVTASTLAIDTVRTDGWTLGRQNLETLWGASGCGLGDEIAVPAPGSLRALVALDGVTSSRADGIADQAGFTDDGTFVPDGYSPAMPNELAPLTGMESMGSWASLDGLSPDATVGNYRSLWHSIALADDEVALMVMGSFSVGATDESNAIAVQWGASNGAVIDPIGIETPDVDGYFTDWSLVTVAPPTGANVVRVMLRDETVGRGDAWVASSFPLGLAVASVGSVAPDAAVLVSPPLALYFPCVEAPAFEGSIISAPGMVINMWRLLWQTTYAGAATSDRYFRISVELDPPVHTPQIGAHLGDPYNFVFVSQEYLTGVPARANGEFTLVEP